MKSVSKVLGLSNLLKGFFSKRLSKHWHPAEMNIPLTENPELYQQFVSRIPLGRWGRLEEIGALALYLCSEDAGFITGTDILIDGGWTAQ